jgi:hypothetical protein
MTRAQPLVEAMTLLVREHSAVANVMASAAGRPGQTSVDCSAPRTPWHGRTPSTGQWPVVDSTP